MTIADTDQTREQLDAISQELAAFTYSVSHDLRAPLRAITGFSDALFEDYGASLEPAALDYLKRVREAAAQMEHFINGLVELSRVSRAELRHRPVDVSRVAEAIATNLKASDASRKVTWTIAPGLTVSGDEALLETCFEHLLKNSWNFTSRKEAAVIAVGVEQREGRPVIFVRDNGAGFDPAHADRLFGPFQRLHSQEDFPGVGMGLALVRRIITRHGGRVSAAGQPGQGATIYIDLQ
jgi:light-regulated signal transduction histidine kinase (bacteriophytochrome)